MTLRKPSPWILAFLITLRLAASAAVPGTLGYEGRVSVGGVPFNGTGQFKFALVNAAGDQTFWSHDGTSTQGNAPTSSVAIEVVEGAYSVLLGSTSVPNMTESLTGSAFTNRPVSLRIWFDDGVGGVEQLVPDQRLTDIGFALVAGSVLPGSVTSESLGPDPRFSGRVTADSARVNRFSVGTDRVEAPVHIAVSAPSGTPPAPRNHVVYIENTSDGNYTHGMAIRLNNSPTKTYAELLRNPDTPQRILAIVQALTSGDLTAIFDFQSLTVAELTRDDVGAFDTVNRSNNYITFFNNTLGFANTEIAGRIEGFSPLDFNRLQEEFNASRWRAFTGLFGLYQVGITLDLNEDWLDPGRLPQFSVNPGQFPTLGFTRGQLPSVDFDPGALPSLTFSGGENPDLDYSFTRGSLPSINFATATFNPGSLPGLSVDFDPGQAPSAALNAGRLPELEFDPGVFPIPSLTGGRLPSLTVTQPGQLPSVNGLPVEVESVTITLDQDRLRQILRDVNISLETMPIQHRLNQDPAYMRLWAGITLFQGGGVTYESGAGDYAEWVERRNEDEEIRAGDVVGLHGGKVSRVTDGADHLHVVSWNPIVLGNMPPGERKEAYEKVAFMGQVPVRVRGVVLEGDFLVASGKDDGVARAVGEDSLTPGLLGQVIGRAWETSGEEGERFVRAMLGLRPNEVAPMLVRQEQAIQRIQRETEELKSELRASQAKLASVLEQQTTLLERLARLVPDPSPNDDDVEPTKFALGQAVDETSGFEEAP
ncbi:MAG: hypothetical protein AB7O66_14845 [Limisphaerales bacterium]